VSGDAKIFFQKNKAQKRLTACLTLLGRAFFKLLANLVILLGFLEANQVFQMKKIFFVFQGNTSDTILPGGRCPAVGEIELFWLCFWGGRLRRRSIGVGAGTGIARIGIMLMRPSTALMTVNSSIGTITAEITAVVFVAERPTRAIALRAVSRITGITTTARARSTAITTTAETSTIPAAAKTTLGALTAAK
jgi:hypothetical protein